MESSSYAEDDDWQDEQFLGLTHLPPGEEGFLQSHAGGEVLVHDIMDSISFSYVAFNISLGICIDSVSQLCSKRYDSRTRRDRIQRNVDAWKHQIPLLAVQYLDWKQHGAASAPVSTSELPWKVEGILFMGM